MTTTATSTPPTNTLRLQRFGIAGIVALFIAAVDQATKAVALDHLSQSDRIPLLGDFLGLQLAFNAGTVMSLGSGSTWIITMFALAMMAFLFLVALRTPSASWAAAVGFVWGGGVGNLIDRLMAPPSFGQGHVTDFIAYGHLFIGNFADIAIGIGVGLALLLIAKNARSKAQTQRDSGALMIDDAPKS